MEEKELSLAVQKMNEKLLRKLNVQYETMVDLRSKRSEKLLVAQAYNRLTIFVNEKGSLCHALHPNGVFIALRSPSHLHKLDHKEYALTYFINKIREVIGGSSI